MTTHDTPKDTDLCDFEHLLLRRASEVHSVVQAGSLVRSYVIATDNGYLEVSVARHSERAN